MATRPDDVPDLRHLDPPPRDERWRAVRAELRRRAKTNPDLYRRLRQGARHQGVGVERMLDAVADERVLSELHGYGGGPDDVRWAAARAGMTVEEWRAARADADGAGP